MCVCVYMNMKWITSPALHHKTPFSVTLELQVKELAQSKTLRHPTVTGYRLSPLGPDRWSTSNHSESWRGRLAEHQNLQEAKGLPPAARTAGARTAGAHTALVRHALNRSKWDKGFLQLTGSALSNPDPLVGISHPCCFSLLIEIFTALPLPN